MAFAPFGIEMVRVIRALLSLAAGAVPLWGVLAEDWTDGTGLALYWCETLLVIPLMTIRIGLHRRWTRKQGHGFPLFVPQLEAGEKRVAREFRTGQFLREFVGKSLGFTLVHGIFLAALLFLLLPDQLHGNAVVDLEALRQGFRATAGILLAGFAWDLFSLRRKSFQWMREETEATFGRLGMVHFAILIGMFAMAVSHRPHSLLFTFFVLRVMAEASGLIKYSADSPEAPKWLLPLMDRFSKDKYSFAQYWREEYQDRQARQAEDELVAPVVPAKAIARHKRRAA